MKNYRRYLPFERGHGEGERAGTRRALGQRRVVQRRLARRLLGDAGRSLYFDEASSSYRVTLLHVQASIEEMKKDLEAGMARIDEELGRS